LAYLPGDNQILVAEARGNGTRVLRLSMTGDREGATSLRHVSHVGTLALDAAHRSLTALSGDTLIVIHPRDLGKRRPDVHRTDVTRLGIRKPVASTFDPASGTWYVLDAASHSVVEVRIQRRPRVIDRISLRGLGRS